MMNISTSYMLIFGFSFNFLFKIGDSLVEALLYGSVALSIILAIALFINLQVQRNHSQKVGKLESQLEHTKFELDSYQKSATNQANKLQTLQKNLEEAQKRNHELGEIFSDHNVRLEQEVRKRTQEIRQANESLQKVVDELDMFIYKTAHDIRGPLARLMGLTGVALLDVKEKLALDYIQKLSSESIHLNNILARLSTIYEINHADIRKENISPETLLRRILTDLEKSDGYERMKFEIFTQGDLNMQSDEQLLEFILKNLLENTIRFRKEEFPSSVKIYFSKNIHYFLIRVIDFGVGINPADAMVIFDMFSRAAGIYKTAGLGLYMTKLSVEKLGGSIALITENAGQTEFRVEIPV